MTDAPDTMWIEPDGDDFIIHNGKKDLPDLIATGYLYEYIRADLSDARVAQAREDALREAARVLLDAMPNITAKPLAEMSDAMKIDEHPAILLRGFCAVLRAIADGDGT